MAGLTSDPQAAGQPLFSSSATQYHQLGERLVTSDGRVFRYVRAGASDLVVGNMIQAPGEIVNHDTLTPSAAAIGATTITVTLGSTLASVDQYAGGWAVIDTTPGLGYTYPITGHPAAASGATLAVTLGLGVEVALTTGSRVTLTPNPYRGVIQTPITTLTGSAVGAAVFIVVTVEYGWVCVSGTTGVLIAGTPGPGLSVVVPGTSAGAVVVDGAASATQVVGSMRIQGIDALVQPVLLNLP